MIDKSNTLDLLLSYAVNTHVGPKEHARRIRKCAKYISNQTKDVPLKKACRALRSQSNDYLVVDSVRKATKLLIQN